MQEERKERRKEDSKEEGRGERSKYYEKNRVEDQARWAQQSNFRIQKRVSLFAAT
jgi:hypothetical protein